MFGMASMEMEIAGEQVIEPDLFRLKGLELLDRLNRVAEIIEAMRRDGWSIVGEVFNLCAYYERITSVEEAKRRLEKLMIAPDEVFITEFEECTEE